MNSTRFDGWPAAVCSCVTLLNITPLSFSLSLSNDMGAGIPEPPAAAQLHITSCGLPWIYRAHRIPAQTNLRIRHVGASMLAKPTESTCRQFNPPQRLALYNRTTRDREQRSPSADRGWCIAGKKTDPEAALLSTGFNFNFAQMLAYPGFILSKPICFNWINPSLELLLFSFSHDSHA